MTTTTYPAHVARTLALHAQQLTTPNGAEPDPTPDQIMDTITRLGCVQIDTLQMVRRSHYVTLWSHLGQYDPATVDALLYDPAQRRLFEYWMHAASIIPLRDYRWHIDTMRYYRNGGGWRQPWGEAPENRPVVAHVRQRIEQEGGLRSADFQHDGQKGGTWWDWKPAKLALEYLYNRGELMIAERQNFQRVYDLPERVLPDWVDTTPPTTEETLRWRVEQAARAAGIGTDKHIADYAYLKRTEAGPVIEALVAAGALVPVEVETVGGTPQTCLVHRDNLPVLAQAAEGAITAARTTFLNPFDNLFWTKGRDEQLWGFRQTLEAYRPKAKRIWGYYCLPILHRDRLVGRFDPKLDRKTGTLILKALYLEPGIAPADELIEAIAATLRDFLAWHGAHDVVIKRSDPADFGEKLLAEL